MEDTEKKVIEEEKEEVEVEVLDSNVVEATETEAKETPEVEEINDPGITRNLTIDEDTYMEFFNRSGIKGQIKSTLYIVIILWILLFLFRGEQTIGEYLIRAGIYSAIFIVISFILNFFLTKTLVKGRYKKSGIDKIVITTKFNSEGIRQSINDQSMLISWGEIMRIEETEKSIFCFTGGRSATILSKRCLEVGDIEFIRSLAIAKIGEDSYNIIESKKKKENSNHYDDEIK